MSGEITDHEDLRVAGNAAIASDGNAARAIE